MPLLTAHPDDLAAAGAFTAGDATTLDTVARLVDAAGRTALGAAGDPAGLRSALELYSRTETTTAAALGEAAALLGRALADAGSAYAAAEESVTAAWAGWPGP